jgi:hypothetical protein
MIRRSRLTLGIAAAHLLFGGAALAEPAANARPADAEAAQQPPAAPAPVDAAAAQSSNAPPDQPAQAPQATEAVAPPSAAAEPSTPPVASAKPESEQAGAAAAPAAPVTAAPQNTPAPEQQPPGPGEPLGSYQRHLELIIGLRTSFVTDDDYRLFARTVDRLGKSFPVAQLSLGAGGTVWAERSLSLLIVGFWDYGGSSSELRGEETDLDVHRLSLGAELRHHYFPWLYSMARLSPAAVDIRASLNDTASTTLYRRKWSYGFDASVGAGAQLFGPPGAETEQPRGWAMAEVGYGWANAVDLDFRATGDAPQRMQDVSLGRLAFRGPMFRLSAALTFY